MPKLELPFILHGGDFNPEQWPREIWDEDVALMQRANCNVATLPVFGWVHLQPDEDTWTFDALDEVIEKLHRGGIKLCLATATAATPPWVDQKYPDILRVDSQGRKLGHGGRHTFCPHSPNFRRLATQLARKMAERYGSHPALLVWHIANEYCYACYCDKCSAAFRVWLQDRYRSLAEVNHRWNMAFWGQTFTDWSQIEAPTPITQGNFKGLLIDYDRFQSEAVLNSCLAEMAELRAITPNIPITTNMMGTFKTLDYHAWAKHLDVVSWDCYPRRNAHPGEVSFRHALMRGLKEGEPWMLMEQTPSQQNWAPYNSLKRPGILRLWSYQAMAHGADTVMYFQWRKSPGAQEMFHGAVVEHGARPEARVFQEVAALGEELKSLGTQTLGERVQTQAAVLFDWDNWWAVEYSSGPSIDLKYCPVCEDPYLALQALGICGDVLSPEADLSQHRLVIAPALKMIKPGVADRLRKFVEDGGILLTTFFTGIVDETDRTFPNGYPGPLADLLGIWIEEFDALSPEESNAIHFQDQILDCGLLCDRIILEGAESMGVYDREFYGGEPALTRNLVGKGQAWHLGTRLKADGWRILLRHLCHEAGIESPIGQIPPEKVEVVLRGETLYLLNHASESQIVPLPPGEWTCLLAGGMHQGWIELEHYGVALLRRSESY